MTGFLLIITQKPLELLLLENKFRLKEFDLSSTRLTPNVITMIGKRGTGMTYLAREIMYHHHRLSFGGLNVINPRVY